MLQINNHFRNAINKARRIQPAVQRDGIRYHVARSDGRAATIKFTAQNGTLWASCDCPAGSPDGRNLPLPCYHVAAVLIASHATRTDHRHQCPACNSKSILACNCATPGEPDYDCDCIQALADSHPDHHYWQ